MVQSLTDSDRNNCSLLIIHECTFFACYFVQQIVRVKKMDEDEAEGTELTEEEILALCEGET